MIDSIRLGTAHRTAIVPSTIRSPSSPFGDIFAGVTVATAPPSPVDTPVIGTNAADKAKAQAADLAQAMVAFRKEASLTPAQRARRDVIEAMGLTEDAIKDMKPEQREPVEKKIAAEVARRLRLDANGPTGSVGTLSL